MNMRSTRHTHHKHTHSQNHMYTINQIGYVRLLTLTRARSPLLSHCVCLIFLYLFCSFFSVCVCRNKQRKWNDQKRMANKTKLQSIGARLRNEDEPLKRKIRNNRTKKKKTNKLIRTVQDIAKWNTMFSSRMAFLSCKTFPNSIFFIITSD